MGFEIRVFITKSKFLKRFQWGKFRTWTRLRMGSLVIEIRSAKEEARPISLEQLLTAMQIDGRIAIERLRKNENLC